jgi:hypothetical protein
MAVALGLYGFFVYKPLGAARGYGSGSGIGGALEFIKANKISGRMFNEEETGATIIGRSDLPVFVDERSALYGPAFLSDAGRWPVAFGQLSDIYHFDYALLLNRRDRYPAQALDDDRGWSLIYADDAALIYVNRSGVDGSLALKSPTALRPNKLWPESLDEALSRPESSERVLSEIDDWILRAPDAAQPLLWKAYAMQKLGRKDQAVRLMNLARLKPGLWRDPELSAILGAVAQSVDDRPKAFSCYRHAAFLSRRRGERDLELAVLSRLEALKRAQGD